MPTGHTYRERRFLGRMRFLAGVLSAGVLLTLGLGGCGLTAGSVARVAPTIPRATASATLGTPTCAAPVTAAPVTPVITPASSDGWATYRDPRFAFQVPLPPGWQPASLTWPSQPDKGGYNYYIVQFFPPGPHGEPGPGASAMAPELIQISVTLSGSSTTSPSPAQNLGCSPEPGTVALGTAQVKLYDGGSPGYGSEISRVAETTSGGYPMTFTMHYLARGAWDPAIAQRDIALFLAMMQGYHPA